MCINKYKLQEENVLWPYGIRYVNKDTFKIDNNCIAICNQTEQLVCEIINHFEVVDKNIILNNKKQELKNKLLLEDKNKPFKHKK